MRPSAAGPPRPRMMSDAINHYERDPIRTADDAPSDPLAPLVATLLAAAGLPAGELARRVREVLPSAIAEIAESNRRLRETSHRREALVADDEEDARSALAALLEPECEVTTAADGEEAVQLARAEHPDLVLMDLFMPRVDGMQALERLRGDAVTRDVLVIFVSARGDDSVKARALDLGAVDYLQKPFSGRELRA